MSEKIAKLKAFMKRNLEPIDGNDIGAISVTGTFSCNGQDAIKDVIDTLPQKYGTGKHIMFDFLVNSGSVCRVIGYSYGSGSYVAYIRLYYFNATLCMKRAGVWQTDVTL